MIRNLKPLIAAAMALAAFGALSATAHAAEEKFHCSVEPCTATLAPDTEAGTTTAHQVFVVKGKTSGGSEVSASLTCPQLAGEATSATKTATEVTFTNLKYEGTTGEQKCKIGAVEALAVDFTSCDYRFTSTNGATSTAQVHVLCAQAGDAIDVTIQGVICLRITPFTATGIGYHDSGIGGARKIVTATANVAVPAAAVDVANVENQSCRTVFGGLATVTTATYTTGNTLVRAENGGAAEGWFE